MVGLAIRRLLVGFAPLLVLLQVLSGTPAIAQTAGAVPGGALGGVSDSEFWRQVRKGVTGTVSIPDKNAATLVQSHGDNLRALRNGPLSAFGGWLLLAVVVVLALFLTVRGRIRIEAGPSGRTVERFNGIERFTHWLTATSFVVLGLTGLNMLYGKHVVMPVIGQTAFAALTQWGKLSHNYIGLSFMIGIVLMVVLWLKDNLPDRHDFLWLAKAGGLFVKGVHPPAKKFNAGQKFIFWMVVLGGISISFSGVSLLFPFVLLPFAPTFEFLNMFGFELPVDLTPLQETQLALLWHSLLALILIAGIIGHIYIGSLGMEGAFDAVSTGQVDENWAREHHSLWVAELDEKEP